MNKSITKQDLKAAAWTDEAGLQVPTKRLTAGEKQREKLAHSLATTASKHNQALTGFKDYMRRCCEEVLALAREEAKVAGKEGKDTKGNFTWYNFDRSVKVECAINERIDFDDMQIGFCRQKLNQFMDGTLSTTEEFVKQLVTDAFSTSRGKLDSKKVMSLLRYRTKIKAPLFQEALGHLEASIRRPDSKTYYRVSLRTEAGEYEIIDLNFSSI